MRVLKKYLGIGLIPSIEDAPVKEPASSHKLFPEWCLPHKDVKSFRGAA
jgi:hypothetical protein